MVDASLADTCCCSAASPRFPVCPKGVDGTVRPINELSLRLDWRSAMDNVTFFAPANPQWVWRELEMMGLLRRVLGNESPFGWCDFVTSTGQGGPCAEFCDHFGPVVRLMRVDRRYEVTCLRTGASKRTTNLGRAAAFIRARWSARVVPVHKASTRDQAS